MHDAGVADDLELGNSCQLGQNVVLHTIGKKFVVFVIAQVFKRQDGDAILFSFSIRD